MVCWCFSLGGRPPSLPNSPLDGQKVLTRSASNPFFNIPMKEPPKYDDAIKQMHNQQQVKELALDHSE